jgi:hypothetical protein
MSMRKYELIGWYQSSRRALRKKLRLRPGRTWTLPAQTGSRCRLQPMPGLHRRPLSGTSSILRIVLAQSRQGLERHLQGIRLGPLLYR